MKTKTLRIKFAAALAICIFFTTNTAAQTTAFNYQGKLNDAGVPASGNYQLQFKLFDAAAGGAQIGATVADVPVTATNGVFSVRLDFDALVFTGANRFLEIAVRHNSSESYTTLSPREQIASTPYSIRTLSAATADVALNSNQLGGIDASEYVTTTSVGNSFIKNNTTLQTANFNISGNGFVGGNLGIGTTTPQSKLALLTGNTYGFTQTNGTVTVGSFLTPGGGWFGTRSNHPLFLFTNDGLPQATLTTSGNFGIGATSPTARLEVNGTTLMTPGGSGGTMLFHTPNAETGLTINGVNRADIRFDGSTLKLLAGTGSGLMPVTNGININTSGNVGIGTVNADTRLTLSGGAAWTSGGWTASMNLRNGAAIAWDANPSERRWGIAQGTAGLNFFRSFSSFGTTASPADYAMVITNDGNITQSRDKGGLVKAMIFVDANGTIIRCYNGMTNSSSGNCGFGVSPFGEGAYIINFNFQVTDRFVSITPTYDGGQVNVGAKFEFRPTISANEIKVLTFITNVEWSNSLANNGFMIILY
jgi:hypothetical protein